METTVVSSVNFDSKFLFSFSHSLLTKMLFSFSHILHLHLAVAFIQSNLQCIQVIHLLSVCVFSGNQTDEFCAANAMLYHLATGTQSHSHLLVI